MTDDQIDSLWEAYNKARANTKEVKVDKAALFALLTEYAKRSDPRWRK